MLWIHKMADAGVALDEIRDAFADPAPADAVSDDDVTVGLRMRTTNGRVGLLSPFRLEGLPEGSLRQADLDSLLVMEQTFSPLGAAVNASRYIALATHPSLREHSDRLDEAEEELGDTIAIDDPRVAQVAAERHAFEQQLHAVIEDSGLAEDDEAIFHSWDALHPSTADEGEDEAQGSGVGPEAMSVVDATRKMPYDFSPARLRRMALTEELAARESPAL